MNKITYIGICSLAIACTQKQPAQSFVSGYNLTDEAMIQLAGLYEMDGDLKNQLSICEINRSAEPVLFVEHVEGLQKEHHVLKMSAPKTDNTGHTSISISSFTLKNSSDFEGLCANPAQASISDKELKTSKCTAQLRWNGQGFDGFWGEACGSFSKELIQVNSGKLSVFSTNWQDTQDTATASSF